MNIDKALELALDGKAIMFAGAGYSYGAKNIKGKPFKLGDELSEYFANKCKLHKNTPLNDSSQEFIEKFGQDKLIKEIKSEFTVKSIAPFYKIIASIPWKHIYTTNYDNVLEISWSYASKKLTPITMNADIYNTSKEQDICIHLNGFVDKLDRETINSELKLTDASYLTASISDSIWMTKFRQDVQYAKVIFFLGYSLADIDIKKILFDSPELKNKCLFIVGEKPNVLTQKRVKRFGSIHKITIKEFANEVRKKQKIYQPVSKDEIDFLSIEEYTLDEKPALITDKNVIDLFLYGDLKKELLSESLRSGKKYFLDREKKSKELFDILDKENKIAVIISNLGNGKSSFIENISYNAAINNYRVFRVHEHNEEAILEFEKLFRIKEKSLIIIDDYQNWLDKIERFFFNSPPDKFLILTARTALHDVLFDELIKISGNKNINEISVDNLTDEEINWFVESFDEYGLWGDYAAKSKARKYQYIREKCEGQIHAILLGLLSSPNIKNKLKNLYANIKKQPEYYKVAISIFILTTINTKITMDTLVDLWGTETLNQIRSNKKSSLWEIINFDRNSITVKSSVISKYFLKNIADSSIVVKVLIELFKKIHELSKSAVKYRDIFKNLMRLYSIQQILPEEKKTAGIMKYYESIKTLSKCKTHPLFWLQYAIASIVINDLTRAKKYFDSAYSYAKKLEWDTFQIDNHYARYLLTIAIDNIDDTNSAMEHFRRAKNIVNRQMNNERLHFPYKVATLYISLFLTSSF